MTVGNYRLRKAESGSGVPGSHELRSGKVVTHGQAQEFDPVVEGIAEYVEAVETAEPAGHVEPAKPARSAKPAKPAST